MFVRKKKEGQRYVSMPHFVRSIPILPRITVYSAVVAAALRIKHQPFNQRKKHAYYCEARSVLDIFARCLCNCWVNYYSGTSIGCRLAESRARWCLFPFSVNEWKKMNNNNIQRLHSSFFLAHTLYYCVMQFNVNIALFCLLAVTLGFAFELWLWWQ